MTDAFDVVIVGAGIAGCACARELTEAGVQVAIVERDAPGGGATAAGMGHIVVMDDSPAQLALTHYARTLWQKLTAELPAAVEYEERGTLWIAADEEEMAQVHAKQASCTRAGVRCEVLDAVSAAAKQNRVCGRAWPAHCWCRMTQFSIHRLRPDLSCKRRSGPALA